MTDTILSSATREVAIGSDRPFVVIGDRINPGGRSRLAAQMRTGDLSGVEESANAQAAAGAQMLDVNAGLEGIDEARLLSRSIERVQSITDLPLSIDSASIHGLTAGLKVCAGRPLLNSVSGTEERLAELLPLVRQRGCAMVASCSDEAGLSPDIRVRFAVARKIVERVEDHGIALSDVLVDPLVVPIGTAGWVPREGLKLISRLREELGVNTICGISNVSFGQKNRAALNAAFVAMAIGAGLTSAILNPLEPETMASVRNAQTVAKSAPPTQP